MQSIRQSHESDSHNQLVLAQKIEYLQNELKTVTEIKNNKAHECQQLRLDLAERDNLVIQKNQKIQDLYRQFQETDNENKQHIEDLLAENEDLKNSYFDIEQELQNCKRKLESLQGELTEIQSKSIEKENELMNYSNIFEKEKQDELSAIKEQYEENSRELKSQVSRYKANEIKESELNKKLQKVIQVLKAENNNLKNEIEGYKQTSERQKEMMNIMADEDSDEDKKIEEIQSQNSKLRDTLVMKEEVSI